VGAAAVAAAAVAANRLKRQRRSNPNHSGFKPWQDLAAADFYLATVLLVAMFDTQRQCLGESHS
jgi:hypothetical protein